MTLRVSDFDIKSTDDNAQSLADVIPDGEFWQSKNIDGTNFRKLLLGLAFEVTRGQSYVASVANNYIPNSTTSFIDDWEELVGIPDECFTKQGIESGNTTSDAARRRDILIKLAFMNLQTQQDYIDLAAEFGVTIEINNSTGGFNQFRWEIKFGGAAATGWEYDWDAPDQIVWENAFVNLIQCIFNKQRPAHTLLEFDFI